jgi:hypothetical protein
MWISPDHVRKLEAQSLEDDRGNGDRVAFVDCALNEHASLFTPFNKDIDSLLGLPEILKDAADWLT